MEEQNKEIKKKIESLLFAAGKKIDAVEIAKLCRLSHNLELIEKILRELKEKYDSEESPLLLMQEGTAWKLIVREKYIPIVQNIVKQAELSKTIMETLAIVAHKAPVLQSVIIKIRTNKAYEHLKELENSGYITREKKGRTKLIKLSSKFFEYFDIPPEKLKERFTKVQELEKAVGLKEDEAKEIKKETSKKKAEQRGKEEKTKEETEKEIKELNKTIKEKEGKMPEVDLIDKEGHKEKLDTYDSEIIEGTDFEEPKSNIIVCKDKFGKMQVVDLGLSQREKKALIKEAAELRKESELAESRKLKESEGEAEKSKEERQFREKFQLIQEEPKEKEEKEPGEKIEKKKPEEKPVLGLKKPKPEEKKPERVTIRQLALEAAEERKKHPQKAREGKKLFEKGVPKGMQEKNDKRVEEIVFGKKEEEKKEKGKKEEEDRETPEHY